VWLTGLPASGKTAIAFALERRLFDQKRLAYVIDPDDGLSLGVHPDGSSPAQTPELARRCTDSGIIPIFAYLTADRRSPGDSRRRRLRTLRRNLRQNLARSAQAP
jgi:adenylylsulfate kinase-like enzyme